jgi:hypothetical protein
MAGAVVRGFRWFPALLVVEVVLAALAFAIWLWTPEAPLPPPTPAPGAAPATLPATLESGLEVAWQQARAWRSDARLISATMQVDWPWQPPPDAVPEVPGTGWLTYVFVAPWQPPGRGPGAASLSVVVERLSGRVMVQTTLGWEYAPATAPPAAIPTPAISTIAAIRLAEAAGGTPFRRACPHYRHVTRISLVEPGEWPQHWLVTYEDARQPDRHGLLLRIDATTHDVLARDDDAPSC